MQNTFIDRLEKTREQILSWGNERIDAVKGQTDDLKEKKAEWVKQGSEKLDQAQGVLRKTEATALETARDLLTKVNDTFEGKAAFLQRGADALDEALVALRSGHSATLPIDGFDDLSIKKILPLLDGLSQAQIKTLQAYEAAHKARKTLAREFDERLAAFTDEPVEADAASE